MKRNGFNKFIKASRFKWRHIRTWLKRSELRFDEMYTDQELLFEGSSCKVFWKVNGAYKIDLFVNGEMLNTYLPEEYAVLITKKKMDIEAIAYGMANKLSRKMHKHAGTLKFKHKEQFDIQNNQHIIPRTYAELSLTMRYAEPKPLTPILVQHLAENELYQQMNYAQENITKPYYNGNKLLQES